MKGRKQLNEDERRTDGLVLVAMMLAALLFTLLHLGHAHANKPVGAPPSTEAERDWFQQAYIPGIGGCCSEGDGFREGMFYPVSDGTDGHAHPEGVILRDWHANKDNPGAYDLNILGVWYYVPKANVLPPQPRNPTGGAVAFIRFNYSMNAEGPSLFIRCFAPGNYV